MNPTEKEFEVHLEEATRLYLCSSPSAWISLAAREKSWKFCRWCVALSEKGSLELRARLGHALRVARPAGEQQLLVQLPHRAMHVGECERNSLSRSTRAYPQPVPAVATPPRFS
jgi:hypothetical protein